MANYSSQYDHPSYMQNASEVEEAERSYQRRQWKSWEDVVPLYLRLICFAWQFIKYATIFYLCTRQHQVFQERRRIPRVLYGKLPPESFHLARAYQKELNYLQMVSCLYWTLFEVWIVIFVGFTKLWVISGPIAHTFWPIEWDQETGESIVFMVLGILLMNLASLPLNLCRIFVIEERYGFNKMTWLTYSWDWIKILLLEMITGSVTGVLVLLIVRKTGKLFFLWLWLFSFAWLLLSLAIYPNVIAPIFDSYSPLREGRLKSRLKKLANFLGFPLGEILVLHQSWRSEHRNAYFYGLLGAKRIVIYDTILAGYPEADRKDIRRRGRIRMNLPKRTSDGISFTSVPSRILRKAHFSEFDTGADPLPVEEDEETPSVTVSRKSMYDTGFTEYEIEAIVARMMGHWVLGHSVRELILPLASMFMFFLMFSYFYENSSLYKMFDVPHQIDKPILLGLRLLHSDVLDFYQITVVYLMRHFERARHYEADAFATKLGYGEDLIDAYIEQNKENLEYPFYDDFYWNFHNSEPSLLQTLAAIEKENMRKNINILANGSISSLTE